MNGNPKSILQMARGAILERVDYEMARIIENIMDVNTSATAKRKLTLTLEFKPDGERQVIQVACAAKFAPVPTNPVVTSLYVADGKTWWRWPRKSPDRWTLMARKKPRPRPSKLLILDKENYHVKGIY